MSEHWNIRGVKRGRQDNEESQEAKLRRKLHYALTGLRKAVKKTKTFEIQKTLKKLKDARRKDPESDLTRDLEVQIEMLKHLSCDQVARSALMTKLKKNKALSADPLMQTISAELASNLALPVTPGTVTGKVQSRILSCKNLASEVVSAVEFLRRFLDTAMRAENVCESAHDPKGRPIGTGRGKEHLSRDGLVSPTGQESDGDGGTSSDEVIDDGWESGTISEPDEAGSGSHDDVTFERDSDDEDAARNKRIRPHGSEFLPSLSVGFARGDSGSELGDDEMRLEGMRKNRRGQRARRAIWEKRFGKNANHVKKQQGTPRRRLHGSVPADRHSANGNSSHPTLVGSRAHFDWTRDRPLHPSWEAKKKHKGASIVPSQGTKIVFGDTRGYI